MLNPRKWENIVPKRRQILPNYAEHLESAKTPFWLLWEVTAYYF
jgi:hypothetical protein